ncbi:hypothetical protein IWW38_000012 [Coemansia aciculifera]|uniref:Uncharacterized protein n=1 Tax=Coemansia aciculifera TaxID=417176 RepID=A0ACC1MAP4_9FUNG|nr:hypothetical protein IWW38_000012 [Coemansia aciculifera]
MRPLSEQVSSKVQSQLASLGRFKGLTRSVCRSYHEAKQVSSAPADIDYEELRETVKSAWRKRDPLEQLRIIAFVVPKDSATPSDYAALSHSNYKELMSSVCFETNQCVFYELESGYSSGQSSDCEDASSSSSLNGELSPNSAVFNEFIVTSSPTRSCSIECPVRLNSLVFV